MREKKTDRVGEIKYNKFGSEMIIKNYRNAKDIDVYFPKYDYLTKNREYQEFQRGGIKCPYEPILYNIGYFGEGKYNCKNHNEIYDEWRGMIKRCYDPYTLNKYPTYRDCFVCEEWHCFQNFAKWYMENYYECNGEQMHLDKDILVKGNKIYSPKTCIFVPERINTLFIKQERHRGKYLIGVIYHKRDNIFEVKCSCLNKEGKKQRRYLGRYDSEFQAFTCYKNFKENYIKQVADEYKNFIPQKLYDAMYEYKVEIND